MEREFVQYIEALILKELGFDKPCFGYYDHQIKELDTISSDVCERLCKHDTHIKAPTFSQAFRWFREKYELEGVTQQAEDFMWYKWVIYQYNENGKKYVADWYEYITYEEAELACLKQLIQIVKQK